VTEGGFYISRQSRSGNGADDYSGPFSPQEVEQQLRDHKIKSTDLVWSADQMDWQEVRSVFEEPPVLPVPAGHQKWIYGLVAMALLGSLYLVAIHRAPLFGSNLRLASSRLLPQAELRKFASVTSLDLEKFGAQGLVEHTWAGAVEYLVIGTNLEPGKELSLQLKGVPETLVGATEATLSVKLKLHSDYNEFTLDQLKAGRALPEGEYRVALKSEKGEILFAGGFFVGGLKNDLYQNRLTEFHHLLADQSRQELEEADQVLDVILQNSELEKKKSMKTQMAGLIQARTTQIANDRIYQKKIWSDVIAIWTAWTDTVPSSEQMSIIYKLKSQISSLQNQTWGNGLPLSPEDRARER